MAKISSAAAKQRAIKQRAARIQLLLMDVDGVWTDGSLYYVPSVGGAMVETKGFDSQDGIGLRWAVDAGLVTGVISGRLSPAVQERGQMLGLSYIYQDHLNKLEIYEQILAHARLTDSQVCFMGDDLTDLPVMRRAGLAVAVANGRPDSIHIHQEKLNTGGGQQVRGSSRRPVPRCIFRVSGTRG